MRILFLGVVLLLQISCSSGKFDGSLKGVPSSSEAASSQPTNVISSFSVPDNLLSLTVQITDLSIDQKSGVTYFFLLNESQATPDIKSGDWQMTPPKEYTFSSAGDKVLFLWVKDSDGHLFESRSVSITVSLPDTTSPVVTGFVIPQSVGSLDIPIQKLTASDNIQVASYIITELNQKPAVSDLRWGSAPPSVYKIEGYKSTGEAPPVILYAWAKDSSGNISQPLMASVRIVLSTAAVRTDMNPPNVYQFKVPATNGGLSIPIVNLYGYDDVGVTGYLVTESNVVPSLANPNWAPSAPPVYVASAPGLKTLYAWAKDSSGKISAPISANTYIYTDTVSDPLVLILVRDYLYNDSSVSSVLNQFVSSLTLKGYANPEIQSVGKLTSAGLRQLLQTKRSSTLRKFAGVFLIGDINQPTYVHPGDFNGATAVFPADMALSSLDSSIDYSTTDGRFSNIRGDQRPKIWIGRIDFSRTGVYGNELDTTRSYLAKLARDESVKRNSPLIGKFLLFIERDWIVGPAPLASGFSVTTNNYPNLTQASFVDSIKQPYEMMHVMVHSNPSRHYFSQFSLGASPGFLVETRLLNLFACSAVLPNSVSLLEPYMLSGVRGGISVIGSTKTGSMDSGSYQFYQLLQKNKTIGDAFIEWQGDHIATEYDKSWHLGMVLNGDPTAKPSL